VGTLFYVNVDVLSLGLFLPVNNINIHILCMYCTVLYCTLETRYLLSITMYISPSRCWRYQLASSSSPSYRVWRRGTPRR